MHGLVREGIGWCGSKIWHINSTSHSQPPPALKGPDGLQSRLEAG